MHRTACHDWHIAHGGRMVDFAGWQMPVQYSTITEEHNAVRRAAGLFDIAHMGRLRFSGPEAGRFLDSLVTCDLSTLQQGQVRYGLVVNHAGGILDDVLVYRLPEFWLLVVNASNRLKILSWLDEHRGGHDVQSADETFEWFMLALQGPKAVSILEPLVVQQIGTLSYYWAAECDVLNVPGIVSRTGYTGEDGFEVMLPAAHGLRLWETIYDRGRPEGLLPAGLGCRDTLRLEAAMPLYGHELDESTDPFTAGLAFAVKLDAEPFLGREALIAAKANTARPRRVGLVLAGRRIAREGSLLFAGDQQIGRVTSGTFSPTLEKSIALAYVDPAHAVAGSTVEVDIRGKREAATVTKLPFYRRPQP